MSNFFQDLQIKKLDILYPKETLPLLESIFKRINVKFDPKKSLQEQFQGKTKAQYEQMLMFLFEEFLDTERKKSEKSSVKYLQSKILDNYLFKPLDLVSNFIRYGNDIRRLSREQIDQALHTVYLANLFESSKVLYASEVNKLVVQGELYEDDEDIKKQLMRSIKKNNYVYRYKYNHLWNQTNPSHHIKDTFTGLEDWTLVDSEYLPTKQLVSNIDFVTNSEMKNKLVEKSQIIKQFLCENEWFFLSRTKWGIQEIKDSTLVCPFALREFERKKNVFFYDEYNMYLTLDDKYIIRQLSLQSPKIIRKFDDGQFSQKEYSPTIDFKTIEWLREFNIPLYIKDKDRLCELDLPVRLVHMNNVYSGIKDILLMCERLPKDEFFFVEYSNGDKYLTCKDWNYFFLLNPKALNSVAIWSETIPQKDLHRLVLFPYISSSANLTYFIRHLLDDELNSYTNHFQDITIWETIEWFGKNEITKITKAHKARLDHFESLKKIWSILPKWLTEEDE